MQDSSFEYENKAGMQFITKTSKYMVKKANLTPENETFFTKKYKVLRKYSEIVDRQNELPVKINVRKLNLAAREQIPKTDKCR